MNTIGSRMRFIRKKEGLKQTDFAKRVLVSASYISKVESDKETPSDIFTKLVALEFGISYTWLKDGVGNIQIDKKEHDYFERNVTDDTNSMPEEIMELNSNIQSLLQNNNTFRRMCISEICQDLSQIIQMDMTDSEKDLIIELLADYLGNIEELGNKLYMIRKINDYSEKSNYYISSHIKSVEKIFHDLSDLLIKSNKWVYSKTFPLS